MAPPAQVATDSSSEGAVERVVRTRARAETFASLFGGPAQRTHVGRFELRALLGEGAMGVVYSAFDPQLQREVALKLLSSSRSEELVLREARALALLSHPHVLPIFEVGSEGGLNFLVSELMRGGTLRAWLRQPRTATQVLDVLLKVGEGLAAGHAAGLVHRDVKPDNVLLDANGSPRLCDFGLARSAEDSATPGAQALPGTRRYMAPEQLAGVRADALSDQFSFALMAFEALTGALPFATNSAAEVHERLARGLPLNEATSSEVRRLIGALAPALAASPEARYPSMAALLAALRASGQPKRKNARLVAFAIAMSSAALAAAIAFALLGPQSAPPKTSERSSRSPTEPKPRVSASALPSADATGVEAEIAREAMSLTRAGRHDECADYLASRATTEALRLMWINCAEYASGPEPLERACSAWNASPRQTKPQHTPELCLPPLPDARKKAESKDYRACAELILAAKPTRYATVQLAQCSARLQDPALFRRVCLYQMTFEPPGSERLCDNMKNL